MNNITTTATTTSSLIHHHRAPPPSQSITCNNININISSLLPFTAVSSYSSSSPFKCRSSSIKPPPTTHHHHEKTIITTSSSEEEESNNLLSFSVLKTDAQCDIGSIWSSIGFYVFSIHIPLSFGGLSAATNILHQPVLDPQVEALLILGIQTLELSIVLLLLKFGKPQYHLSDFFRANNSSKGRRSWLLASAVGFGFLLSLVFVTSYIADILIGTKDVNNPILKEILSSGTTSLAACTFTYCIVTPLLEEVVYRGFLLTSLASQMKWPQAVALSSVVFSAAHLSGENSLQLLVVGFVLGCSYCWTGNLSSSIAIHSLYNALILFSTFMS